MRVMRWECQRHGGCLPIAIIRRTPDGDNELVKHELVALHRQLVCSRDKVDSVLVRKLLRDVRAKEETGSAR